SGASPPAAPPPLPPFPPRRSSDLPRPRASPPVRRRVSPFLTSHLSLLTSAKRPYTDPRPTPYPRPGKDAQALDHHPSLARLPRGDRKSTRLNSSHVKISYAVFCLK